MDLPHQGVQADFSEFSDAAFGNRFSVDVDMSGDATDEAQKNLV